jgi:hypothetical protein
MINTTETDEMEIYIIIRGYNQYPKASKIPADN